MPSMEMLVSAVLAADEKESEGDGMKCVVCGKEFTSEIKHKICCSPECRAKYKKDYSREREKRRKKERMEQSKKETAVSPNRLCKGCKYTSIRLGDYGCDYILIEGHRRPCPSSLAVGRKCDVYTPGGMKRHYVPSFS